MRDISVTKNKVNGSIECSTMYAGYLRHIVYYGCTKREALQLFRQYLKDLKGN